MAEAPRSITQARFHGLKREGKEGRQTGIWMVGSRVLCGGVTQATRKKKKKLGEKKKTKQCTPDRAGVSRCCDAMPQASIMRCAKNRRDTIASRARTHLWPPGLMSLQLYSDSDRRGICRRHLIYPYLGYVLCNNDHLASHSPSLAISIPSTPGDKSLRR